MSATLRTRKPVNDLSQRDLAEFPIWEYATDEEGTAGQDETWVRPTSLEVIPSDACALQVAAEFALSDGTVLPGYVEVTTNHRAQFGGGAFGNIVLFTGKGVSSISSIEPTPREVRDLMRDLGKPWLTTFPIRLALRVLVEGEGEYRSALIDGDAF